MKRILFLLLIGCGAPAVDPVVGASCAAGPVCEGDSVFVCEGPSAAASTWKLQTCPKCAIVKGNNVCTY